MTLRSELKSTDDSFQRDWDEFKETTERIRQEFLTVQKLHAKLEPNVIEKLDQWENIIREGKQRVNGDAEECLFEEEKVKNEILRLNIVRNLFLEEQQNEMLTFKKKYQEVSPTDSQLTNTQTPKKYNWNLNALWSYLPTLPRKDPKPETIESLKPIKS